MSPSLQRRRRQKGSVAVEAALSMVVMILIVTGGMQFSDAVFIRQQLGAAAQRAARTCATVPQAQWHDCAEREARRPMSENIDRRCQIEVTPRIDPVGTLPLGVVDVACVYNFDWLSGTLGNAGIDHVRMTASAAMPIQTP